MNKSTARTPVTFTVTHANAFELLAGFRQAALVAGWTESQIQETVAEAISSHYDHLQWVLIRYCMEPRRLLRR